MVTTSGTYTVTVTGANSCTATAAIVITGNATAPTASITNSPNTTILNCTTTSISLTANGVGSYRWSAGGATTALITVTAVGTYTVTVTGANSCTATASTTITSNVNPPTVTINIPNACHIGTAKANVTGGSGNYSYNWGGGPTPQDSITFSYTGANAYQTTVVAVTVTDNNTGCTATASGSDTIFATSVAGTAAASHADICLNGTAVLSLAGNTGNVVRWESAFGGNPWADLGGAGQQNFISNMLTPAGTYKFRAVVQNGSCAADTSNQVTANVYLPQITGTPAVCENAGTTTLNGSTLPDTLNTWASSSTANATISGLNSQSATITGVAAGTTTITYTDINGCKDSVVVTIDATTVAGTATPGLQNACKPQATASLSITGNNGTVTGWEQSIDNGTTWTSIQGSNSANYAANNYNSNFNTDAILYRAVVQSGTCQSANSNVDTFIFHPIPIISGLPPYRTLCLGSSVTLTGTGTPNAQNPWSCTNPNSFVITSGGVCTHIPGNAESTITYTDSYGCYSESVIYGDDTPSLSPNPVTICTGAAVNLTANTSVVSWSSQPPDAITAVFGNSATFTASSPGDYVISATTDFCTGRSLVTVGGGQDSITANGPTAFCAGGSVTLDAGPGATYSWGPNGEVTQTIAASTSGNYTVTVTSGPGCTATATQLVAVSPDTVGIQTNFSNGGWFTNLVCPDSLIVVTGVGANSYIFTWTDCSGATQTSTTNPTIITADACGESPRGGPDGFVVTVTGIGGCAANDRESIAFTIFDNTLSPTASNPNPANGEVVTLKSNVKDYPPYASWSNFNWSSSTSDAVIQNSNQSIATVKATGNMDITLTAISPFGCKAEAELNLRLTSRLNIPNILFPSCGCTSVNKEWIVTNPSNDPALDDLIENSDFFVYDKNVLLLKHGKGLRWDGKNFEGAIVDPGFYTIKIHWDPYNYLGVSDKEYQVEVK